MDLRNFLWSLIFFANSILLFSQEKYDRLELGFSDDGMKKMILVKQGGALKPSPSLAQPSTAIIGNNIYIQQIGGDNSINSSVSSGNAIVNLEQNGRGNRMYLKVTANIVRENVEQTGNNNFFFDFVNSPLKENHLNVEQKGNYNLIIKYGANSISDKIQYKLQGDFRSLIIKNYP